MREEKQLLLDEIEGKLSDASALVMTRYSTLAPNLSHQLRSAMVEAGGGFTVVPKRVFIKAAKSRGIELSKKELEGHIGIAYAKEDPITATKALIKFAKDNEDLLEVLAGHFDGALCSASDVKAISELPSQDEMRAQFLGLLEAPMAETVSVMQSLLTSVIYCLENKSQQT